MYCSSVVTCTLTSGWLVGGWLCLTPQCRDTVIYAQESIFSPSSYIRFFCVTMEIPVGFTTAVCVIYNMCRDRSACRKSIRVNVFEVSCAPSRWFIDSLRGSAANRC